MSGYVEFYKDENGEHRFRVKAGNNEIVFGGEGYGSLSDAGRGFEDSFDAMFEAYKGYLSGGKPAEEESSES